VILVASLCIAGVAGLICCLFLFLLYNIGCLLISLSNGETALQLYWRRNDMHAYEKWYHQVTAASVILEDIPQMTLQTAYMILMWQKHQMEPTTFQWCSVALSAYSILFVIALKVVYCVFEGNDHEFGVKPAVAAAAVAVEDVEVTVEIVKVYRAVPVMFNV